MLWVLVSLVSLASARVEIAERTGIRPFCPKVADQECSDSEAACHWEHVTEYIVTGYRAEEVAPTSDPFDTKPVDTNEGAFLLRLERGEPINELVEPHDGNLQPRTVENECSADESGEYEINAVYDYENAADVAVNDLVDANVCYWPYSGWWGGWRCRRWCPWWWHWNWNWHWCPWHHWHHHWWPYHYHWWHWHWPWCHWGCGGCWWWHWHWHWPWWNHWCRPWWHMPRWCGISTQIASADVLTTNKFAQIDVYPNGIRGGEKQVQTVVLNQCETVQRFVDAKVEDSCPADDVTQQVPSATCYSKWVETEKGGVERKVYKDENCEEERDTDDCTPVKIPPVESNCKAEGSDPDARCFAVGIHVAF